MPNPSLEATTPSEALNASDGVVCFLKPEIDKRVIHRTNNAENT